MRVSGFTVTARDNMFEFQGLASGRMFGLGFSSESQLNRLEGSASWFGSPETLIPEFRVSCQALDAGARNPKQPCQVSCSFLPETPNSRSPVLTSHISYPKSEKNALP